MKRRTAKLAAVRLWLHDSQCSTDASGQCDRVEHARRTQHQRARSIVDAPTREAAAQALHSMCALGDRCPDPVGHGERAHARLTAHLVDRGLG